VDKIELAALEATHQLVNRLDSTDDRVSRFRLHLFAGRLDTEVGPDDRIELNDIRVNLTSLALAFALHFETSPL